MTELRFSRLGPLRETVASTLDELAEAGIVERIWNRDHTVWGSDPTEIADRLGWLGCPDGMGQHLATIENVVSDCQLAGYDRALLLGMGGSSLAPEVFQRIFGVKTGFADLDVIDSTDPGTILAHVRQLDVAKTVFVPATKSGGTIETISLLRYFYGRAVEEVGNTAGEHFIAITDPGSGLADLARELKFRHTFLNDPHIGGRYSALSYFGLFPAALIGVDTHQLVTRARTSAQHLRVERDNQASFLGSAIGAGAHAGRNKLTLITSPTLAPLGVWIEQLVAESTGKNGKGVLPVAGERLRSADRYGEDRLFVYLRLDGESEFDAGVDDLTASGQPVIQLDVEDEYALGDQLLLWELATAIAGHLTGVNPFDQPNVEAAKELARSMVSTFQRDGSLPSRKPDLKLEELELYGDVAGSLADTLGPFFGAGGDSNAYVAVQAYVPTTPETDAALADLREKIGTGYSLATSVGYGPRYLHSTGQLHKGDGGNGIFLQLTCDDADDVAIPDAPGSADSFLTFGLLKAAQAMGDMQALVDGGRRVLRVHLGSDVPSGIGQLADALP